jgi:multidrug efflux pump subunit AcrA (membrane-fusion protein)
MRGGIKMSNKIHDAKPKKKNIIQKIKNSPIALGVIALVVLAASVAGLTYLQNEQSRVYVEKSEITAPIISLGPRLAPTSPPAILDEVLVKEGDTVTKNKIVARLRDGSVIRAGADGIVLSVKNVPGQAVGNQDSIVKIIDPREMRVVGRVEENKGLTDLRVGQKVTFTVDAFPSKEYQGVVDIISPTARSSDIVFSISDKREQRQFDVKVKYDIYAYPELKNGMSAKMWIHK